MHKPKNVVPCEVCRQLVENCRKGCDGIAVGNIKGSTGIAELGSFLSVEGHGNGRKDVKLTYFNFCKTVMTNNPELNISLEPHLQETLKTIVVYLPKLLSEQLDAYLSVQSTQKTSTTIPYPLLRSISQWSRTPAGLASLNNHDPAISPHDYTMIALLAGTTTSPERRFPAYISPETQANWKRNYQDRKAITAVLNALLSILGSGAAAWWAAESTAWRPEWVCIFTLHTQAPVPLVKHDSLGLF